MFRELGEVNDEIYLLKKKYKQIDRQIHTHKGKSFDKHRTSINSRNSYNEYHAALNKIYQRHAIFKNMERQIFLMNVIEAKKNIFKDKHEQSLREITLHRERDINYAEGNYLLKGNDVVKSIPKHISLELYLTKQRINEHYSFKKMATNNYYRNHYNKITKQYNIHRDLAHEYRKQLNSLTAARGDA
jgi:hypothetical protein